MCHSLQVFDYYVQIKMNDLEKSIASLYRLVLVTTMLRRVKVVGRGKAHQYPTEMLSHLLILEHWRKIGYVGYEMMKKNTSVNNEEAGESAFSLLARAVVGDNRRTDIQHLSDVFSLLPLYREIKEDIRHDLNFARTISGRTTIKEDSTEVAQAAFFFNQLIIRAQTSRFRTYDGSKLSFTNRTAATANLTTGVTPIVYNCDVLDEIPGMFEDITTAITGSWLQAFRDLWPEAGRRALPARHGPNTMRYSSSDSPRGGSLSDSSADTVAIYYGAPFEGCQVAHFAATEGSFPDGALGICLYQIRSIDDEEEWEVWDDVTYQSFQGVQYTCTKPNTHFSCCTGGKWFKQRGSAQSSLDTIKSYHVIHYFPRLDQGKLPSDVVQAIQTASIGKVIFKEPTSPPGDRAPQ